MILGLVADTHLLPRGGRVSLPPALLEGLAGCSAILHAGDLACREVIEALAALAPVQAVLGNVDDPGLGLPTRLVLHHGGFVIGLTHGHLGPGATTPRRALRTFGEGVDVVVFGHSHQALIEQVPGGPLLCNPGSPTQPRGRPPTFIRLDLSGARPLAELVTLAARTAR